MCYASGPRFGEDIERLVDRKVEFACAMYIKELNAIY